MENRSVGKSLAQVEASTCEHWDAARVTSKVLGSEWAGVDCGEVVLVTQLLTQPFHQRDPAQGPYSASSRNVMAPLPPYSPAAFWLGSPQIPEVQFVYSRSGGCCPLCD